MNTPQLTAEHYQAIIESSEEAIIGKTLTGIVTSWNQGAEQVFGYSAAEMLGQSLLRLFPHDRQDEEHFILKRILQGEKVEHFETLRIHKDGHHVHVSVNISPIRDAHGTIIGASKIAHDITALKVEQERLQLALNTNRIGLWDWNLRTGYVYRSEYIYTASGYAPQDDTHDFAFFARTVHPQDLPAIRLQVDKYVQGVSTALAFDFRLVSKTGLSERYMRVTGQAVERDGAGKALRIVGTQTDITGIKQKDAIMSEREKRLSRVLDGSDQGYWDWNLQTNEFQVSARWETMLGYAPGEMKVSVDNWSNLVHPDDFASAQRSIEQHINNKANTHEVDIRCLTKSGEWKWISTKGRIVEWDADGKPLTMSGTHTDISQLKAHEAELNRVAHFDPLTGTPNRRLLADRMSQTIMRTNRSALSLAVCYLDLDGFKSVNDRLGHSAGDQLLIAVTENIKSVLRAQDTIARLGGDEFVLLLADIASPEECSQVLERVLQVVATPVMIDGHKVVIHASIGVSMYPQDHADADTLLRHADQAMYRAKDAGKNCFHMFDSESDRKAQEHRALLEQLQFAIEHDELRLHYQPKIDLLTGEIVGMEALVRWQNPQKGLLSPGEFLPHVEKSNLVQTLGVWVLNSALAQATQWKAQGHTIKVSVNISADHLLHPQFAHDLQQALTNHPDIAPQCLELEVLESTAIDDLAQAIDVLNHCHAMGVTLALDDFGTGYSSLTYLRKLPVDLLKIDQSFVRDMLKDSEDLEIVEGVVRLASAFHRKVIAEGVETLEHGKALLALGCRLAQGYGVAKPMPPEQVLDWCAQWTRSRVWESFE